MSSMSIITFAQPIDYLDLVTGVKDVVRKHAPEWDDELAVPPVRFGLKVVLKKEYDATYKEMVADGIVVSDRQRGRMLMQGASMKTIWITTTIAHLLGDSHVERVELTCSAVAQSEVKRET